MNLTQRERIFIIAGVVFIAGILVVFGFRLLKNKLAISNSLQQVLTERQQIENLGQEYKNLLLLKQPQASESGPTIDQYMENLINQMGLSEQATLRPSENVVQNKYRKRTISLSFRQLTAQPMLDLIQRIEAEKGNIYKVEYFLSRSTVKNDGNYVFNLRVSSFEKKES